MALPSPKVECSRRLSACKVVLAATECLDSRRYINAMRDTPRLNAVATAVPPHTLVQTEVARAAEDLFSTAYEDFDRLIPVYTNAQIETRNSCVPLDWYLEPHSFSERNDLYVDNALDLIEAAALKCLDQARLDVDAIDGLVVVSSTGVATSQPRRLADGTHAIAPRYSPASHIRPRLRRRCPWIGARGIDGPRGTWLTGSLSRRRIMRLDVSTGGQLQKQHHRNGLVRRWCRRRYRKLPRRRSGNHGLGRTHLARLAGCYGAGTCVTVVSKSCFQEIFRH